jgi:hypothetical protein
LSINLYGQTSDSLDFKVYINKITNDSLSNYYYPRLLERVRNHPSEIGTTDCFYLYYGQIFQKTYKPFSHLEYPERQIFERAANNGNCKKVLELGNSLLDRNPVDLSLLLNVCNCSKEKKYSDTTYFFEQRLKCLLDAIFSTGDGKSMNTAIRIVGVEDDYILKGIIGFLGGIEKLDIKNNHAYSIWENNGQRIYFEDVMNSDEFLNTR